MACSCSIPAECTSGTRPARHAGSLSIRDGLSGAGSRSRATCAGTHRPRSASSRSTSTESCGASSGYRVFLGVSRHLPPRNARRRGPRLGCDDARLPVAAPGSGADAVPLGTRPLGVRISSLSGRPRRRADCVHGPWAKLPERHCEVEVWLDQSQHELELVTEMWSWIADRAMAEDPGLLLAYCGEDEPVMLDSLAALGYKREGAEKVWELDLKTHGARLRAEATGTRAQAEAAGIRLTTLADWDAEDKVKRLYELDSITRQDIPSTMPILTESLEDCERRS